MAEPSPRAELAALALGDHPGRWRELGFTVSGDRMDLGGVAVALGARGEGIVGWSLRGAPADVDGLPVCQPPAIDREPAPHSNGAVGIDHVVLTTPDFSRTSQALSEAGLELRRVVTRPDGARIGFRRLGPAILEVVQTPSAPRASFWGLVIIVSDLDALAERLGDRLGPVRPAVQPGRRIATLQPEAGLGEAVAFMDPES